MDKGRVASDIYLLHEVIFPGKEVFVLTNKRAVYAVANSVLGGWSSEWEYLYHEIHDMPTIQQEGSRWFIIIHPKVGLEKLPLKIASTFVQEERKSMMGLFGRTSGKKIFLPEGSNKESAQMLARTIEDLRTRWSIDIEFLNLSKLELDFYNCSRFLQLANVKKSFFADRTTLTRSSSK